jgi:hypothetical protein
LLKHADAHHHCPSWVSYGGAGPAATRQVKLNKRTHPVNRAALPCAEVKNFGNPESLQKTVVFEKDRQT